MLLRTSRLRTSLFDHRRYQFITLSNDLKVLVVQDYEINKSAISACVHAGHFDDPDDCHGLAHLLEHMLFLGNQEFPESNQFNQFLSAHNGNVNAWTATEFSNFHFEVDSDCFSSACQQFAAMLACPVFDKNKIKNEIDTIDAEFKAKVRDDLRRLYQVHKETTNPNHPFSKFSVGNRETFEHFDSSELGDKLSKLHQQYYVSGNIQVCVLSNLDIEEIQVNLEQTLSCIPKGPARSVEQFPALYQVDQLATFINIEPLKQAKRLIVTFALPGMHEFNPVKPLNLVSHLLGDEGEGSILSYLKANNWASTLSAGGGIQGSNFKDFNINLQLTDYGLQHVDEILSVIFSYLDLMKQGCYEVWRYQEKAKISELAFEHGERSKPLDEVSHLANQMFWYADDEILSADYLMQEFNADVFTQVLSYFTPENMRVKRIFQGIETDRHAKWYQTPYSIKPIDPKLITKLNQAEVIPELKLPAPNPYLLDQVKHELDLVYSNPHKISRSLHHEVWLAQDTQFAQPKGDAYVSFDCKAVEFGIESVTYKRLWVSMLNDLLAQEYYQAGVAGLHFHLYSHQGGFSLNTSGFSRQQLKLCNDIYARIFTFEPNQQAFENGKARQLQGLQNSLLNKPVNRLFTRLSAVLQKHTYAPSDMLPVLMQTDFALLQEAGEQLMQSFYLEAFLHGDWGLEEANVFSEQLLSKTMKPNGTKLSRDVVDITGLRLNHGVASQHADSAIVKYFQAPSADTRDTALTILLEQLIAAPFFHRMRSEKQLGYLVGTGYVPVNQHPGIALYIQSPNQPVALLVNEIDEFIALFINQIGAQSALFEKVKKSAIKQLHENDRSLSMKSQRLWLAIGNADYQFNQQQRLRETIAELTLHDLRAFCAALIANRFGQLDLYCNGNQAVFEPTSVSIDDINLFKQSAKFFK